MIYIDYRLYYTIHYKYILYAIFIYFWGYLNYLLYKLNDLCIAVKQIIINNIVYYIILNNKLCRMKIL